MTDHISRVRERADYAALIAEARAHHFEMSGLNTRGAEVLAELADALEEYEAGDQTISSWRYISAKRTNPDGEEIWNVQEIYTGPPYGRGWTASEIGMVPYGETREVLIRDLENMLSDMHNNEYVDLDTDKVENVLDCKREEENK